MIFATCILVHSDNAGLVGSVLILHHLFISKELAFATIDHSLHTLLV